MMLQTTQLWLLTDHLHNLITHFDTSKHVHGCVAHVINLLAKEGVANFELTRAPDPISSLSPIFLKISSTDIDLPDFIKTTPQTSETSTSQL